ncbi:Prolyl 4-hydroxylase subunit alpha [Diplonema papillatum]|nr:Prolyl 4-hydroxylase subunit alpha [Diplonema papillatum]
MSTLWGDEDELPPPCSSAQKRPETFDGLKDTKGGAHAIIAQFGDRCVLGPGAVVVVNKTGQVDMVLETFSTYIKLCKGTAVSRHAVTLLCGPVKPYEPVKDDPDRHAAKAVVNALRGKNGCIVIKDLLTGSYRKAAAAAAESMAANDAMFQAGTGKGAAHKRDGVLRGDHIQWLAKDGSLPGPLQYLANRMNALRRGIVLETEKPLLRTSSQLARYPGDGVGYVRHRDAKLNASDDNRRRVTCVYYFNENWQPSDGGCLELYPKSGLSQLAELKSDAAAVARKKTERKLAHPVVVPPESGTLVIFNSCLLHSVLPEHAPRTAMTMWFCGPESLGLQHPESEFDIDSCFVGRDDVQPSK